MIVFFFGGGGKGLILSQKLFIQVGDTLGQAGSGSGPVARLNLSDRLILGYEIQFSLILSILRVLFDPNFGLTQRMLLK